MPGHSDTNVRYGPRVLSGLSDVDIDELVAMLGNLLAGRNLVHTAVDLRIRTLPEVMFTECLPGEPPASLVVEQLAEGPIRFIQIEVGVGIKLRIEPLTFRDRKYHSRVQINGDHIIVGGHYLFGEPSTHHEFYHTITRAPRSE